MQSDMVVAAAKQYIETLFAGNAGGHGADHTLRVYRNAMAIAEGEICDPDIVALTALLHDADDHKLFDTKDNANARAFLRTQGVPDEMADRICEAINSVSFSQNRGKRPETIEGKIVQDADRLDAIGAVGVAHTFAYGGEHGRSLDDSIAHFHEKLLLLKDEMNTKTGKRLAEERHTFLLTFLAEYQKELEEVPQL